MKKYTEKWLRYLSPCADGLAFAESCKFNFAKIYDTCQRGDWLIWLLRKTDNITKAQAVAIAITGARHILKLYEKKYPGDKRPRRAVAAAAKWLKNPTEQNRQAAYAAHAAYAVYAADATADAAVDAAAYVVDSAAYTAADTADAEHKWQANKIRRIVPNPFK
jgi:hypothetical protein